MKIVRYNKMSQVLKIHKYTGIVQISNIFSYKQPRNDFKYVPEKQLILKKIKPQDPVPN